jgi:hypothetical protein
MPRTETHRKERSVFQSIPMVRGSLTLYSLGSNAKSIPLLSSGCFGSLASAELSDSSGPLLSLTAERSTSDEGWLRDEALLLLSDGMRLLVAGCTSTRLVASHAKRAVVENASSSRGISSPTRERNSMVECIVVKSGRTRLKRAQQRRRSSTQHTTPAAPSLMMCCVETNENTSGKYFDHNSQMTLCERILSFKEDTHNIKYHSQDRLCTEQMLQTERNFQ